MFLHSIVSGHNLPCQLNDYSATVLSMYAKNNKSNILGEVTVESGKAIDFRMAFG